MHSEGPVGRIVLRCLANNVPFTACCIKIKRCFFFYAAPDGAPGPAAYQEVPLHEAEQQVAIYSLSTALHSCHVYNDAKTAL